MPVTTRIITADSGSRRSAKAALKSPEVIQVNSCWTMARASGSMPTSPHTAASETANEPAIAAQASAPETGLLRRRPKLALTRNPRNGSSGISSSTSLPFQLREHVGVQRFPLAEQRDHDRQADRRLRRGDGHHKEDDDLTVGRPHRAAERDKRQIDGV